MKNGERIPWNATAICEIFRIFYLMGNHHVKAGSESPLKDQWYRLEQLAVNHPISAKDISRLHQFGSKVLPGIFLGYVMYAGGIWKGDIMVADIEEVEEMDASELHARWLNAKEVFTPMKGDNFIFPVADGTVKVSGGDQRLRTSFLLIRDRPERGEEQEVLRGEPDGLSSPTPLQADSTRDGGFLIYHRRFHLSPSCGTPSQTVHAKRRIISYSIEIHRRHQKYPYIIGCVVGEILTIIVTWMEKENYQMHGQA